MYKICNSCFINKELIKYNKDKKWLYWFRSICKNCQSIYNQKRYINKKDIIIIKKNKYDNSEIWKELSRIRRAKRRALINNTCDNTINYKLIINLLKQQNYKCNYCWKDILKHNSRHLDHIYPLSKWWIHSIKNVQWLCCKCNLEKYNKIFVK